MLKINYLKTKFNLKKVIILRKIWRYADMELREFHPMTSVFLLIVNDKKSEASKQHLKQILGTLGSWSGKYPRIPGQCWEIPSLHYRHASSPCRSQLSYCLLEKLSLTIQSKVDAFFFFYSPWENHVLFPSENWLHVVIPCVCLLLNCSWEVSPNELYVPWEQGSSCVQYCTFNN